MAANPACLSNNLHVQCSCWPHACVHQVSGGVSHSKHCHNRIELCCTLQEGNSPLQLPPKRETSGKRSRNPLMFLLRLLLGSTAGFYYFVLPVYMWIKDKIWPRSLPGF